MPKLRVGVVYGGRSGEHEVSLMSARSIISALDPEKYEVTAIGITKSGQWVKRPIPDEAEVLDFTIDNPDDQTDHVRGRCHFLFALAKWNNRAFEW